MDNRLSKSRLNYIDVYKGVSIFFVIITHYEWTERQRVIGLFPFWIEMAVPVFMVITGYLYAISLSNRGIKYYFGLKNLVCKLLRFIIPFFPIAMIQIVVNLLSTGISLKSVVSIFVTGGAGPGAYYFPVMLQLVLLIPFLYSIVDKYREKGLVVTFAINVIYEALKTYLGLSPGLYRLLIFRYIFIVSFGCYLWVSQKKNLKDDKIKRLFTYIVGILGLIYIIVFNYTDIDPLITPLWTTTSVFAVLFIVPIMVRLMSPNKIHNRFLELCGRASFNIFLTQMIYYWVLSKYIYEFLPLFIQLPVNIIICITVGIIFYLVENPITSRIISMIKGKKSVQTLSSNVKSS